ncbi:hypothetical protein ACTNCE_13445 [Dorea longicatena]|uniref:hypothetical protein n=1 Tax=Dorea longicatena TaxID=88431 RepID=UPI003F8B7F80
MENKEKKQMLTTELTKEKSGGSAGMIQDMSINGIKLHLAQNETGGRSSSGACIHISRTK